MTDASAPRVLASAPIQPTMVSSLVFAAKVAAFQARRSAIDLLTGPRRLVRVAGDGFSATAGRSATPLWPDESAAEQAMQRGKVHNLRIACRALDGLAIPAGATFSFWRQVGRPGADRGFAPGRMLKQGCLVPVVGGGLCQLSNALYEVALQAGCHVVERHPHSRVVPGSSAALGRDATVAWNYVDLRFVADRELRLTARLDRERLTVALMGRSVEAAAVAPATPLRKPAPAARSCASCGETECFAHGRDARLAAKTHARRAWLVDEAWPEFRDHVRSERRPEDWLGRPLGDVGPGVPRYGWAAAGFDRTFDAGLHTLRRGLALRHAAQGPARRRAELEAAGRIAATLARRLSSDVTAVTVAQSYLPHLWREGWLGGREVSVLMTRLPASALQARLDAAFARHPERHSLADYRAPADLIEAEDEALAAATRIITPHAEVAALFGERAVRLDWRTSPSAPAVPRPIRRIAFPGPTIARKGAHAVRDAAVALGLDVTPMGAELEGAGFWEGVDARPFDGWPTIDAVVQPALVEDQPRALLAALAAGVRVIATPACGLDPQPGLTLVPPDDPGALIGALGATD